MVASKTSGRYIEKSRQKPGFFMARKKRYRKYVERPTAGGFRLLPAGWLAAAGWLLQVGGRPELPTLPGAGHRRQRAGSAAAFASLIGGHIHHKIF